MREQARFSKLQSSFVKQLSDCACLLVHLIELLRKIMKCMQVMEPRTQCVQLALVITAVIVLGGVIVVWFCWYPEISECKLRKSIKENGTKFQIH